MKLKNELGNKYKRLTVIERAPNRGTAAYWLCQCECGNQVEVVGCCLRKGITRSCGCLQKEVLRDIGHMKPTKETRKKISESLRGHKVTKETRKRMGKALRGKSKGNKNGNWKGGVTPINNRIRKSTKYSDWRTEVFERDHYQCQMCFDKYCYLEVHHIHEFSKVEILRFAVYNGITLCKKCHEKTFGKEMEFRLKDIVQTGFKNIMNYKEK